MGQSAQDRGSSTAPDPSELVLAFVNTHPSGGGRPELFADRAAFTRWLEEHQLITGSDQVSDDDAATARDLRDALAVLLQAHATKPSVTDVERAESYLHRIADRLPLVARVDAEGAQLLAAQSGVTGAFAAVLAAVTTVTWTGRWSRLKMCKNPPCHTGFVDKTKNGAGLFCSTRCGSQLTMRAYRSRSRSG